MKLLFDREEDRKYETGVSEGVLFVKKTNPTGTTGATIYEKGVAWNGLTAVTESPEGAEETALYADNIKYLSLRSLEEFKGTIEAYTYPDEFAKCNGELELVAGLGVKASQQARAAFAFAFKTKKGTQANPEAGFVLHLIYGCTASPSEKAYETVNDSPSAITFSWEFTTVPVAEVKVVTTDDEVIFKNVAHLELDSTVVPEAKMTQILEKLYGTDGSTESATGTDPVLLMPSEIVNILQAQ